MDGLFDWWAETEGNFQQQLSPYRFCLYMAVGRYAKLVSVADGRVNASSLTDPGDSPPHPSCIQDSLTHAQRRLILVKLMDLMQKSSMSFAGFKVALEYFPALWNKITATLETIEMTGLNAVCDAIVDGEKACFEGPRCVVKRTSTVGHFVREVCVWYEQSSMTELCLLTAALRNYIANADESSSNEVYEQDFAISVLMKKVELLESGSFTSIKDILADVEPIRRTHPALPLLHVVDCLVACWNKNYPKAMEAVHDYFDSSVTKGSHGASSRFGSLCLTRVARKFGFGLEARKHLSEAVRLSQEFDDVHSLQEALVEAYLLEVGKKDSGSQMLMVDRSLVESKEHGFMDLHNLSALNTGRIQCSHYADPIKALSQVQQCLSLLSASSSSAMDADHFLQPSALALLSTMWLRHGNFDSSSLFAQLLLSLHWNHAPSVNVAISNLAYVLASKGDFEAALSVLEAGSGAANIELARGCIKFQMHILAEDFQSAKQDVNTIRTINPVEANFRNATLLTALGNYDSASKICTKLISDADVAVRTRALICLADISEKSQCLAPILEYLTQALHLAKQYHLVPVENIARLGLAKLKSAQKQEHDAWNICFALQFPDAFYGSQLSCLKASLLLANSGPPSGEAAEAKNKVLKHLKDAEKILVGTNDKAGLHEVYYRMSLCYDDLDMVAERNEYARKFRQLDTERNNGHLSIAA